MAKAYKPVPVMIQDGGYVRLDLEKLKLIPSCSDAVHEYTMHMNTTDKTELSDFMLVGFPEELETNVSYNYHMKDMELNEMTRQVKIRSGLEELVGKASKLIKKTKAKFMLVDIRNIKVGRDYSEFNIKIRAQGLVEHR